MDAWSLEVSARSIPALRSVADRVPPGTLIAIPYLPNEDDEVRLAAARAVRELGFQPMPHLSTRRIDSRSVLERFVTRAVEEAAVEQCFVIAGDPSTPSGPFADSGALIATGILEGSGIRAVAVGGHPENHPVMNAEQRWQALQYKCEVIEQRGMTPSIVTQFAFDAGIVLGWLQELRSRGIEHPVRVGVPGPASVVVLARYAAMCGVGASAAMLARYGVSIGKLLGTAGPGVFVDQLSHGLTEAHGHVSLHFFPFGGISQSLKWIEQRQSRS